MPLASLSRRGAPFAALVALSIGLAACSSSDWPMVFSEPSADSTIALSWAARPAIVSLALDADSISALEVESIRSRSSAIRPAALLRRESIVSPAC